MNKPIATIRVGPTHYQLAQGYLVDQWEVVDKSTGATVTIGKIQVGSGEEYFIGELCK